MKTIAHLNTNAQFKDRQTDRQRQRQTDRQTKMETESSLYKQTDRKLGHKIKCASGLMVVMLTMCGHGDCKALDHFCLGKTER